MFNAPEIIIAIPDVKQIYDINDSQISELNEAVEQLDNDIFFSSMGEERTARWEKILGITPLDNYSLKDRRTKVHLKVLEKVPYSYRVLKSKLDTILGEETYTLTANNNVLGFTCSILDQETLQDIVGMLENIVPLNMYILAVNNIYTETGAEAYIHTAVSKTIERTISTK